MAGADVRALSERLMTCCVEARLTVATAESCTGGRVGDALTDVPGSSDYVRGGIIAYADEMKVSLLGVPGELIRAHGSVSAQVARAMAEGARSRCQADLAVAVTGIAGPGGARPGKPVGLTYIAVASPGGVLVRRATWDGDREANKTRTTLAALELLVEVASGIAVEVPRG